MSAILAGILLTLCSCSVIKSLQKNKTQESEKTQADSTVKTDAEIVTKITELADTTIRLPGSIIEGSKPFSDIINNPLVLEDGNQIIIVSVDSSTGNVTAKGKIKTRDVSIFIKRVTETKEDKKTTTAVKVKSDKKSEVKTFNKDVKRTGMPLYMWLIIILVILAILYGVYIKFFT